MHHLLLLLLALLTFTLAALAGKAPLSDPRNHPSQFNPSSTLCDDTLQWLMIEMIEDIETSLNLLENDLPEADYAKLETRAMELGAKLAEPLDPKPMKE